jgi:hypothetical protein
MLPPRYFGIAFAEKFVNNGKLATVARKRVVDRGNLARPYRRRSSFGEFLSSPASKSWSCPERSKGIAIANIDGFSRVRI